MHFAVNGVHFFLQRNLVLALRLEHGINALDVAVGIGDKVVQRIAIGLQNGAEHFQLHVVLLTFLLHFLFQKHSIGYIFHVYQHAGNVLTVINAAEIEVQKALFLVDIHFLADQGVERGDQTLFGTRIIELADEVVGGVQVGSIDEAGQHIEQVFAAYAFLADKRFELLGVLRTDGQVFVHQEQTGSYRIHNLGGFFFRFICQFVSGEQFADEVAQEQGKVQHRTHDTKNLYVF